MGNILWFSSSNSQQKAQETPQSKHTFNFVFNFFFHQWKTYRNISKPKSSDQVLVILPCLYEKVKRSHRTLHTTLSHEEPSGTAPRPVSNDHFSPQSMEPDPFKQNNFYWQLVFLAYSRLRIYQRKALQDNSVYCRIISVNTGNTAFTE